MGTSSSLHSDARVRGRDEDDAETGSGASAIRLLESIDAEIDLVAATQSSARGFGANEYIEAIESLSMECSNDDQSFDKPKKKARGNHGYFRHVEDQRVHVPRNSGEAYGDYLKRLHRAAKQTWQAGFFFSGPRLPLPIAL